MLVQTYGRDWEDSWTSQGMIMVIFIHNKGSQIHPIYPRKHIEVFRQRCWNFDVRDTHVALVVINIWQHSKTRIHDHLFHPPKSPPHRRIKIRNSRQIRHRSPILIIVIQIRRHRPIKSIIPINRQLTRIRHCRCETSSHVPRGIRDIGCRVQLGSVAHRR